MWLVSALADMTLLLPASLALIALLARSGARGEAVAYGKALIFCLVATFAMKFALAVCGRDGRLEGVESPSGHVAFAVTFYGGAALMIGARRAPALQALLAAGLVAFTVLVAASRVVLRAHSRAETIVGAATGLVALAIFFFNQPRHAATDAPLPLRTIAPLTVLLLIPALGAGRHITAEPWIDAMAREFGLLTHICR